MIRISEMVLPGHPDKFCDQVADAVIAECMSVDQDAYGQVEVSVWSDQVWLSGGTCTRDPMHKTIEEIVVETGESIGYTRHNHIDARRYKITDTICKVVDDPSRWSSAVNDQSIVIGWAGYDENTRYLPPEHYLAHVFREALINSCHNGNLVGQGPDGKLLVRMKAQNFKWEVEHLLVTLQQKEADEFAEVCIAIVSTLKTAYEDLCNRDPRWVVPWEDIELMINPNGPLVEGGSDGDNGQTGRKLVLDYYGPGIPLGGGALSGKHLSHIDRIGAYAARDAAVRAVQSGADECFVRLAYAPNTRQPLDVSYEMTGNGRREPAGFFEHSNMVDRYRGAMITTQIGQGRHFFDAGLQWNGLTD